MNTLKDRDAVLTAWLDDGPHTLPAETRQAIAVGIRTVAQRRSGIVWPFPGSGLPTIEPWRLSVALGSAAVVVVVAALALNYVVNQQGFGGPATPSPIVSPSPAPITGSGGMWPQSTLDEVRQAQELADAGDPTYAWQLRVDGGQIGQHHPCAGASIGCWSRARNDGSGEIFIRFLEEELGWEEYFWHEALSHSGRDDLNPGDVVFVRCAPGLANPLYPTDPGRPGCAPTIDELRYETVKINVAQLDRQGPSGIWVVTGWEMVEPVAQADPRVVEAEVTALMEAFLQARIDGEGAEELADFPADVDEELVDPEIPLLYATSTGAPYERTEYELADGPAWPDGWMRYVVRLFDENGETTVEQHFSLDWDESDRLRLVYDFEEGSGDGPGTTENGNAVPMEYGFLDGEVTYRAAYPLGPSDDGYQDWDRLAIVGLLPDDDAPRQILTFLADPRPIGPGCVEAPAPADAEALARSIGSDPNFEGTAPVAVTIGGLSALQMDGVVAHATSCGLLLQPISSAGRGRAHLYLLDLPGGSARVLGIAIAADDDSFETVLEWAAPIVDSIEFNTP